MELLYEELTKEEQLKQQRKEQKKLKRKRKKERMADEKENCNRCETPEDSKCSCAVLSLKDKKENCKDCNDNKKYVKENLKIQSKDDWYENECKCSDVKKNAKCAFTSYDEDSDLSDPTCKNGEKNANKEAWSSSEHSHDCGYSSENNNGCCETVSGASSLPSSPEGSEMACSGSCCNLAVDCPAEFKHSKFFPRGNSIKLSLQQMLEVSFHTLKIKNVL